jgi:hypothetical protein
VIDKEEVSDDMVSGRSGIVVQISMPGQEGKTITISQNGVGLEVITRDTSGLFEREIL